MVSSQQEPRPFFLAGVASASSTALDVADKYSRAIAARAFVADGKAVDRAIQAAAEATDTLKSLPAHRRRDALLHVARGLAARGDELADTLVTEVGKTIGEAKLEVSRATETFFAAAEEATRLDGEFLPLDTSVRNEGLEAIVRRVPIGAASFITPFNFPLNLAAHKVGPALAAGCPFVLKPDPRTPLSSLILGEIVAETSLPEGAFSVLPVVDEAARDMLVRDERLRLLSFTGSSRVGWSLKERAGKKRVLLELGGIATCIVDGPLSSAEVEPIADRLTLGVFFQAGQSCISTQRILVHRTIAAGLIEALVARAGALRSGDPRAASTQLGPMIGIEEAARVQEWIAEAVAGGASLLVGGGREGAFMEPTLLTGVPPHCRLAREEVFGPVGVIEAYDSWDEALHRANATRFGLQAAVFTNDLRKVTRAWNELEVGAVVVNDIPGVRADTMPYGGVKDSGLGREGVRYAIQEMTELRALVIRSGGRRA